MQVITQALKTISAMRPADLPAGLELPVNPDVAAVEPLARISPVSYTHLTLPTIYSV